MTVCLRSRLIWKKGIVPFSTEAPPKARMHVMETARHLLWTKTGELLELPGEKSWHNTCINKSVKEREGDKK
jgi:hypothetical protein